MTVWDIVVEALGDDAVRALRAGPEPDAAAARLASLIEAVPALRGRADLADALVAVCGASRALPAIAASLGDDAIRVLERQTVSTVDLGHPAGIGELRRAVARQMLAIAALDLTGKIDMPAVGASLSDLADAAARSALAAADPGPSTRLAVIALGKWGGGELNYASDIDLLFVHDGEEAEAIRTATAFMDLLSRREGGGIAFRVDADLRPEGRSGPMSRSVESFRAYWERWAETWEFQAMLKARSVAGDPNLGSEFMEAVDPFVFPDTLGADAVRDIRAMKARAEEAAGAGDEVKRGIGGIRDAEFAIQLLQLVHGRADDALRTGNTLEALARLGEGGYVREDDARGLAEAYRWLRDVEHRLQLYDLRQTHTLPDDPGGRERVAKALGLRDDAEATALDRFERTLVERRSLVRTIHERLFYRPLLESFAAAGTDPRADRQAAAFGFTDSEATRAALIDLTAGLSRRSRLMQQLLPLMMKWLSESPEPDLGLAQLRLLVTTAAGHDSVIPVLRDNPATAERLCLLLGTSRLAGRLIDRLPATLGRIGDDSALGSPVDAAALTDEALGRVAVRDDEAARAETLHRFEAEHLLEISAADVAGFANARDVGNRLADAADAVVATALDQAMAARSDTPPMAVIAMGKWGGRELNYASDLDALIVFRSGGTGADEPAARVAEALVAAMGRSSLDLPSFEIDLDLRPEGRKGPIARSLDSYTAYWERWAETWEHQSLLRARLAAGDADLGAEFVDRAAAFAHPEAFTEEQRRHILAMKARVEKERIPLGEDPDFHMKLGRGGMSDVEWTVQLLQMEHGATHASVRSPSTLEALAALRTEGVVRSEDADALDEAYRFCASVRNRLFLRSGRTRDSLPTDPDEAARLARSLGYDIDPRAALREEYRRVTRRARRVVERVFYGR
ncbi:MAG TPA: bifunctional [glutamine synthetase] adenylyltransferase/[glutamine synthetase]-adenylyl-L-tyrosine phosphorylase [Acidimicrobiia bacterium]|nr:bifunctional [glutamine synthetase] adenylyltransferase/[glutamine synthetase]-adenylyl-L-tyrosine phosphorylase [Acidimicrobiia bacterium]